MCMYVSHTQERIGIINYLQKRLIIFVTGFLSHCLIAAA